MNANDIDLLLRNNTGNKDKNSLIESFVIRTKPFNNIFNELKLSKTNKPEQNYLIIGQRGAGKTTLLYRLKYAIEDDSMLNQAVIPIMFAEEQYHLMDLVNLWESIAEYLGDYSGFQSLSKEIDNVDLSHAHREERAYDILESKLLVNNKKIIVFIENIDVFFKKIGQQGQKRLREVLTTSTSIRLICSATTYFEGVINYSDPFYEFFKIVRLDGLNKAESKKLLIKLGEQKNELQQIQKIVDEHPKRLESLRRLTGGNPRIISYLFQIFLDNENGKAIVDLYKLLDDITFLYKAELDQLSAQQQKIIDAIARNWDAISTKEIASKINLDSKHISSILKTLEKNQIIESINTKTKNNLYRLKDRFLNIWYLMRFGKRRDKENVIWLVRFYDTWCDKSELSQRISAHINNLKNGKYDVNAALDMGNVFLSCENVTPEVKLSLYRATKSFLPQKMIKELKLSENSLYETIKDLVKKIKYDEALELLKDNKGSEQYFAFASWIYFKKHDFEKLIELLKEHYQETPKKELAFQIGHTYELLLQDFSNAIRYYNLALEQNVWEAAYHLGQIYFYNLDDLQKAEYYHRIAINNGETRSVMALATIYYGIDELEKSKELVLLAISKGEKDAKNNLATLYLQLGDMEKAISVYQEAIDDGISHALLNLGSLYMEQDKPDYKKAQQYFEEAIAKGEDAGYYLLGRLFMKQEKENEAESYLLTGAEKGDANAAHLLGHFYCDNGSWSKAEKYFLKSVKHGRVTALMCLFECAFREKKESRKALILKHFEEHLPEINQRPVFSIGYARLLLWNDEIEKSIAIIDELSDNLYKSIDGRKDEEYKEDILSELASYFILLISKGQFNAANRFFQDNDIDYRQLLKPVYYALMNYMQKDYPLEHLKAGEELQETIKEIIGQIEQLKNDLFKTSKLPMVK